MLQTLCAGRKHIPVRVKQPSEERSSPSHPPRLSWRRAVRGLALSARARGVSLQNAPPLQTGKICFFCVAGDTLGWGTRLARGRKGTRLTSGRAWPGDAVPLPQKEYVPGRVLPGLFLHKIHHVIHFAGLGRQVQRRCRHSLLQPFDIFFF